MSITSSHEGLKTTHKRKLFLAGGFFAVAAGIALAHRSPADGYELSLYAATPATVWALLLVAAVVAVAVLTYSNGRHDRLEARLASVLAGLSVLVVVGMPLIRNYSFYGLNDALNHLGFARMLSSGYRGFYSFIYPGPQTFAVAVGRFTGWGLPRSMLLVTVAFVAVFVLFVPLAVSKIVSGKRAVSIAVVSGLLVMPINNISTTPEFHNFSLATLFTPLAIYLFLSHVTGEAEDARLPLSMTAVSILLPLVGGALLLFHPLTMFDFLIVLITTTGLQLAVRRWRPAHPIGRTRGLFGQAVLLVGLWTYWSSGRVAFERTTARSIETLVAMFRGTAEAAPELQATTASAQQLQVDLVSLFLRLMLVEFVAALVVLGLVVWYWSGRLTPESGEHSPSISYFALGGIALLPVLIVQIHGDVSHLFFRHLGFVYVIVSILLAVGLNRLRDGISVNWAILRPVVVVVAVTALVLSMAAFHPSPFIYQFTPHTPEGQLGGYEAAFEEQPPESNIWFGTFRVGTRYKTALAAAPGTSWYPDNVKPAPKFSGRIPDSALLDGVVQYYETHPEPPVHSDHYVPLSTATRERETRLYDGLRYSEAGFESLERQEDVHRIRSSGEMTWYYVNVSDGDSADTGDGDDAASVDEDQLPDGSTTAGDR